MDTEERRRSFSLYESEVMPCVASLKLKWRIGAAGPLIDIVALIDTSASRSWSPDA